MSPSPVAAVPPPGSGRGGCHPAPAVAGEDGPSGAGGRVFGGTAHRHAPPVSTADVASPARCRAARQPQHLPLCCLPGPRSTATGPASSPSLPAGSTQRWPTTGMARWGAGNWRLGAGSDPPSSRSPSNRSSQKLSVDEMYLLDSGGQYLCVVLNLDRPALHSPPCPHHAPAATWWQGTPKPALVLHCLCSCPPFAAMGQQTSHGLCTGACPPPSRR